MQRDNKQVVESVSGGGSGGGSGSALIALADANTIAVAANTATTQLLRDGRPFVKNDMLQLYFVLRATLTPEAALPLQAVFGSFAREHTMEEVTMLARHLLYDADTIVRLSTQGSAPSPSAPPLPATE